MADLSLKELQELRERGFVPGASMELVNSFDKIKNFIYRFKDYASRMTDVIQPINSHGAYLYRELEDRLDPLVVAGYDMDLSRPYSQDSLLQYRNLLENFINNDFYELYRALEDCGALTENAEHKFRQLDYLNDDFQMFIKKENLQNEELFRGLQVDAEDVILPSEHITEQKKNMDIAQKDEQKPQAIEPEEIKTEQEPQVREARKEKEEKMQQTETKKVDPVKEEPHKSEPSFQKTTEQKTAIDTASGTTTGLNLDKKQEAKDASKKSEDLMAREDVRQDKADKKTQSNKEAIEKLRAVANMFDPQHSDESFKKMMLALKDISQSKLVPNEMIDSYRYIFNEVKEHRRNTEVAIFDLSTEIYNQIADLESADKEIATLNKVQDFLKHYSDVYQNSNPGQIATELNKLRYVYNNQDFRSFNSDAVDSQINAMIDKLLTNLNDKEIQQKTIEDLMVLTNEQKESLIEEYYPKTKKTERTDDVLQKRKEGGLREKKQDKDSEKRKAIESFQSGAQKVLDMDAQQEEKSRNEIDRSAIAREATRRQKLLMGRK